MGTFFFFIRSKFFRALLFNRINFNRIAFLKVKFSNYFSVLVPFGAGTVFFAFFVILLEFFMCAFMKHCGKPVLLTIFIIFNKAYLAFLIIFLRTAGKKFAI